jgi:hypothetical protein
LHYSRLCYPLDEEKILHEPRNDIVDALTTDAKEEFYVQYEMTDKLLSLYLSLGKYGRALDLLEGKGNLDKAWEVIEEYGEFFLKPWPLDREVRIYNYAQSRDFLASLSTETGEVFLPDVESVGAPISWPYDDGPVEKFWDDIIENVDKLFTRQLSYSDINFSDKWMKQFLDITVGDPTEILVL